MLFVTALIAFFPSLKLLFPLIFSMHILDMCFEFELFFASSFGVDFFLLKMVSRLFLFRWFGRDFDTSLSTSFTLVHFFALECRLVKTLGSFLVRDLVKSLSLKRLVNDATMMV